MPVFLQMLDPLPIRPIGLRCLDSIDLLSQTKTARRFKCELDPCINIKTV